MLEYMDCCKLETFLNFIVIEQMLGKFQSLKGLHIQINTKHHHSSLMDSRNVLSSIIWSCKLNTMHPKAQGKDVRTRG
jgi:hypothetical protein